MATALNTDEASLGPAPTGIDEDAVSLPTPVNPQPTPPPDVAQQRTNKTQQGLGDVLNKPDRDIYQTFLDGKEDLLRSQAATALDYKKAMAKQQAVQAMSAKGPLDPEQIAHIMDPFNPINTATDPGTVIERAYSTNYVSSLNTASGYMSDSNPLTVAQADMPQQTQEALDQGSELLTKNQYILKRVQDAQTKVSEQTWPGFIADQAKQFLQPYLEYKQRGLVDNINFEGIGLGSNLQAQSNALYGKPTPEFKKTFDAAMDYLEKDNPSLAVAWAASMLGQDSFEKTLNNVFSALAIPDAATVGTLGAKLIKKGLTYNQVRRAARDIVDSAARDPNATTATMAEGAGAVGEAAVRRVAAETTSSLNGTLDPLQVAKQALVTTWKDDAEKYVANPGTYLSREGYTRIHDGFARDGEDLVNRMEVMSRVERMPLAVTSEDVIRSYKDQIRADFKGPPAAILDIQGPFREEASNTYWYKKTYGNYDATLFSDSATAEGFAKQLGLADPIIKSKPSANLSKTIEEDLARFENEGGATIREPDYTKRRMEAITKQLADKTVDKVTKADLKKEFKALEVGKAEAIRPPEQPLIAQQGLGFYIEHWIPMRETDNLLRDLMTKTSQGGPTVAETVSTNSATGTNNLKNSLLGWVRNSDDTLSINESAQRKAVTYTQSNIQRWAKALNQDLEDIKNGIVRNDPVTGDPISPFVSYPKSFLGKFIPRNKIYEQFERVLDYSRRVKDPATGEDGYFFKTGQELQEHYNRNYNRDPSFLETKAYFNYVKVKEGERVMGEMAEFRNRAREGYEQFQLKGIDGNGKEYTSGFFDARPLKQFPGGDDYILVMGDKKGGESLYKLGHINDAMVKDLRQRVQDGRGRVIELYDIDHHPLNNFSEIINDQRVRYAYSNNMESKPLAFNHVNRRGGAHFEWDYDSYLKQADVRTQITHGIPNDRRPTVDVDGKRHVVEHIYVGDKTVMPIKNRKMGQDIARLWNQAHDLIKQNRWDEVRPIAARMGIDWREFTGWYHPGRDAEGKVVPPRLNPHEPMMVVTRNKKIKDIDSALQERYKHARPDGTFLNTFKDGTKTGTANNFKVAYNTERNSYDGMKTINDIGTQGNPVYAYQPANFVDPISTMNRSLNRAINSTFMDDYKIHAVEHWLREAEPFLKDVTKEEVRSSPFWHFNNAEFRNDVDITKRSNLLSNKYKIQTFIGIPSKFDAFVHSFTEHLAANAYSKYGPEANRTIVQKSLSIPPIWVLHHLKNPVDFIRGVTFNYKLGLFNPAQFIVQAQTHALIWSLEPQHGTAGTYAMMLHAWSRVNKNPNILNALDNYATKLSGFGSRFRPGEFLEAMGELDRTGFAHVAGEYANLSKAYLPTTNFIQNDISKGLRLGQTPFRLGEQSTRITAWYTAFRKFREANPTAPITNKVRNDILNHADLLTVNMSRASSSVLNHGVFSLSSQFLSYQIKLAELFWSKRIGETAGQRAMARARIMTGFALLYGMPNAIGVTGAPISDNIRTELMDNTGYLAKGFNAVTNAGQSYIPGEKYISTLINEGWPAWTLAMITGKGDIQAGNIENVGDRYGSQGWQNIKQWMRSDIPMWQALGGASASTMAKFISSGLDPFYQGALSWIRGDTQDQRFTVRSADLIEPWKQISTVSQGTRWWTAIQTGKWMSSNESNITDVSPFRATYLALTGMSPQEQDDMFLKNELVKGETDAQKVAFKEAIKDWRRGIQAKEAGDEEQGNAYHRNAMARLTVVGYPEEKKRSFVAIANKGYEKAIDNANYRSWSQGDQSKSPERLQTFKRQMSLDEKRRSAITITPRGNQ